MPQQLINLGITANDRTGTKWRAGGDIINDNFTELYGSVNLNETTITSEASFPVQDASTLTIPAGEIYVLSNNISTSKELILEAGAVYTARNQFGAIHTYTGSGDAVKAGDVPFTLDRITFAAPTGQVFNITGAAAATTGCVIVSVRVLGAAKLGTFTNYDGVDLASIQAVGVADGLTIAGTTIILSMSKIFMQSTSATFIGLDLGSSIVAEPEIINFTCIAPAGAIGITGLANSGNIPVGARGMMSGSSFTGGMTPNTNIVSDDIRWDLEGNPQIQDSRNAVDAYLTKGTATEEITITTAAVFEEIGIPSAAGVTWASDVASRFTVGTDGVITYIGEKPIDIETVGRATVEKVGGGSDEIEVRIAKNWVFSATPGVGGIEKSRAITQNATPTTVPVSALISLVTNDNIRLIFANNTGTANILAQVSSIEITD